MFKKWGFWLVMVPVLILILLYMIGSLNSRSSHDGGSAKDIEALGQELRELREEVAQLEQKVEELSSGSGVPGRLGEVPEEGRIPLEPEIGEEATAPEAGEKTATQREPETKEIAREGQWTKVGSWQGSGIKNTEPFTITGKQWRINWSNKAGDIGGFSRFLS